MYDDITVEMDDAYLEGLAESWLGEEEPYDDEMPDYMVEAAIQEDMERRHHERLRNEPPAGFEDMLHEASRDIEKGRV